MERTTTTHDRAEPERTCVGCRLRRPQSALVRCAITDDGRAVVSRTAAGRGAWLCRPPADCLDAAVRRRAFQRAWRRDVDPAALAGLAEQLGTLSVPAGPPAALGRDDEVQSSVAGGSGAVGREDEKG